MRWVCSGGGENEKRERTPEIIEFETERPPQRRSFLKAMSALGLSPELGGYPTFRLKLGHSDKERDGVLQARRKIWVNTGQYGVGL
jgi:hypothetical protein